VKKASMTFLQSPGAADGAALAMFVEAFLISP
jgi:hypothetical protein